MSDTTTLTKLEKLVLVSYKFFQVLASCIWLGLTFGLRMDLCRVQITYNVKQLEYVELQQYHVFTSHYLHSSPA